MRNNQSKLCQRKLPRFVRCGRGRHSRDSVRGSCLAKRVRRGQQRTMGAGNVSKSKFDQSRGSRISKAGAGVAVRDVWPRKVTWVPAWHRGLASGKVARGTKAVLVEEWKIRDTPRPTIPNLRHWEMVAWELSYSRLPGHLLSHRNDQCTLEGGRIFLLNMPPSLCSAHKGFRIPLLTQKA